MKLFSAPYLRPERVVVVKDGEPVAFGEISMLTVISAAIADADEVYLNPDAAADKAWLISEQGG